MTILRPDFRAPARSFSEAIHRLSIFGDYHQIPWRPEAHLLDHIYSHRDAWVDVAVESMREYIASTDPKRTWDPYIGTAGARTDQREVYELRDMADGFISAFLRSSSEYHGRFSVSQVLFPVRAYRALGDSAPGELKRVMALPADAVRLLAGSGDAPAQMALGMALYNEYVKNNDVRYHGPSVRQLDHKFTF
jgi:hypothetical protein